ncbi:CAAX amino terminal protease family protein [Streptococcus pneumoniae]|nr:CAAX amino terminal protease family protein [Streptococcus pneumoniae]
MKAIYSDIEMILMFGGAIFFVFLWIRFVEKLGIVGSLVAFLIQGATEEIVVRGWLFPVLSVRSRIWIGIVVTSFLFGFLHLLNPGITILSISNIILVGVFAAFYVLKDSSLWGICAWHSIWNWAQYNVFGFAVSGMTMYSTPLFKPVTTGSEFLHGGSFGIEGSIITTIMLTIASIVLWRKLWGRKAKQRNFS